MSRSMPLAAMCNDGAIRPSAGAKSRLPSRPVWAPLAAVAVHPLPRNRESDPEDSNSRIPEAGAEGDVRSGQLYGNFSARIKANLQKVPQSVNIMWDLNEHATNPHSDS